jgi:hypothetical protein
MAQVAETNLKDTPISADFPKVSPITTTIDLKQHPEPDAAAMALVKPPKVGAVNVDIVPPIAVGSPPTNSTKKPSLRTPALPGDLTAKPPGDAPDLEFGEVPVAGDYVIPELPQLETIEVPDSTAKFEPIAYEDYFPSDDLQAPLDKFLYSESPYTSDLITSITGLYLDALANSSTGLSALAEDTLYNRAADRNNAETARLRAEVVDRFAAMGFPLPPGALAGAVTQVDKDNGDKLSELNREVYLDQSKRAFEYNQFIITSASQWELALAALSDKFNQRMFEVAKFAIEAQVLQFNAEVSLYNARLAAYTAWVAAYKTRIESQLAELEYYKSELEAAQIKGQLRQQDIQFYEAQLQAVNTEVGIYKTEVEAYGALAFAQSQRIGAYKAGVDAYAAQVSAKSDEYKSYAVQVDAELSKVKVFATDVEAYKAEVLAYNALIDAEKAKQQSVISTNASNIDAYKARLSAYNAELSAEAERVKAEASSFSAFVRSYSSDIEGQGLVVKLDEVKFQAEAADAYNRARLDLQAATTNVANMQKNVTILTDLNKAGADIMAGVGSSAFSAVSTSASYSGQDTITARYPTAADYGYR